MQQHEYVARFFLLFSVSSFILSLKILQYINLWHAIFWKYKKIKKERDAKNKVLNLVLFV